MKVKLTQLSYVRFALGIEPVHIWGSARAILFPGLRGGPLMCSFGEGILVCEGGSKQWLLLGSEIVDSQKD